MSWRLRVRHTTAYEYAGVVHASYNEARISPLDTPTQFTLEHRGRGRARPRTCYRYRDYWGSRVHAFDIHHEHTELVVTGTSVVETAERTPNHDTSVAWDAIDSPGLTERFFEYLTPTTFTRPDDGIVPARRGPAGRADAGRRAVLRSGPGCATTSSTTRAPRACRRRRSRRCAARRGVCQDFAHLGLAALRAAGIPARYA